MGNLAALVPVALFLAFAVGLSVVVRHRTQSASDGGGFVKEYFIGNRGLGGFVLAMTTIATYGSVSSFVGGPGQAWSIGFGWVYMAVVQVTALVLLYGIVGKKMALIARKLDAITVADVIRARYGSNALANLSAAIVVVFFGATMIAQFVGGAKLFEAVTGYSYVFGLVLFGVAVILFTTIGGFRGVALTDALCGIAMLVGIVVLAAGILDAGGGYEAIMGSIAQNHPEMLEPTSGGNMPPSLYLTQWLLVGVFTFVLPQSVVRTMGYKDVKSLHDRGHRHHRRHDDRRHGARRVGRRRAHRGSGGLRRQRGQHHPAGHLADVAAGAGGHRHHRAGGRLHLHRVLAAYLVILGAGQGRVDALRRSARPPHGGACAVRVEPGGYAGAGRGGVRAGRRAARRHMEDQHVRLRRP